MTSFSHGEHTADSFLLCSSIKAKAREQVHLNAHIEWDLYVSGGACLRSFLFVVSE